jgi:hypothetical protein
VAGVEVSYLVVVLYAGSDDGIDGELTLLVERRRSHCGSFDVRGRLRYSLGDSGSLVKLEMDGFGRCKCAGWCNSVRYCWSDNAEVVRCMRVRAESIVLRKICVSRAIWDTECRGEVDG